MLALFSRTPCHSRLLSLRQLATQAINATETVSSSTPNVSSAAPTEEASTSSRAPLTRAGPQRLPLWWSDTKVDARGAYRIIQNRFKAHGSQREENYRQMISRVKTPEEAALALEVLDEGRRLRAVLQQHVPFTFHTSQLMITTCVKVKAFETALQALKRAQELGLQFFRADAYYAVMKGAVLNQQLDLAIKVFETMKQNGVRPGGKVVHNLIMGSIINGRRDLAEAYAEEFRYNGIKINKASEEWLDGSRKPVEEEESNNITQGSEAHERPLQEQEKSAAVTSA